MDVLLEKAPQNFLSLVWLIEESIKKRREEKEVEEGKERGDEGRERKGVKENRGSTPPAGWCTDKGA